MWRMGLVPDSGKGGAGYLGGSGRRLGKKRAQIYLGRGELKLVSWDSRIPGVVVEVACKLVMFR